MRVLVACEFSGIVRDAFIARGHDAISVDLLPSERPGPHMKGDVFNAIEALKWRGWHADLMVAHPPCTHLAVSGARWFKEKRREQEEALEFVRILMGYHPLTEDIPRIALENPISVISSRIRKPDQRLKGLPKLQPTEIVGGRTPRVHHASPGPDRWKERSRTLPGIAQAMAEQWGVL